MPVLSAGQLSTGTPLYPMLRGYEWSVQGEISRPGEQDLFQINLMAGEVVHFSIAPYIYVGSMPPGFPPLVYNPLGSSFLRLLDLNGTPLETQAPSSAPAAAGLTFRAPATSTYVIEASSRFNATGNYTLSGSYVTDNDVTGNGTADVLWHGAGGEVVLWSMLGLGVINSTTSVARVAPGWEPVGLADVTGDGRSDALWHGPEGEVVLWAMGRSSSIGDPRILSTTLVANVSPEWKVASMADMTGDGLADILWRGSAGEVVLWGMDGGFITSTTLLAHVSSEWKVAGIADVTDDGLADVLWHGPAGEVVLWEMSGDSITNTTLLAKVSPGWKVAGMANATGDAKADILWRGPDGEVVLWAMDGASIRFSSLIANVPIDWNVESFADATGDGEADLLWHGPEGEVVLWGMDGAGIQSTTLIAKVPVSWDMIG